MLNVITEVYGTSQSAWFQVIEGYENEGAGKYL